MQLSIGENLAERAYALFQQGRMTPKALIHNWHCLNQRPDNIGAYYLIFLLLRSEDCAVLEQILPKLEDHGLLF